MKLDEHGLPDESELTPEILQEFMDVINVVDRFSKKIGCDINMSCLSSLTPYISINGNIEANKCGIEQGFWAMYIRNDGSITKTFIH